ncbi:AAA family ATPase [Aggregatilinea lenta]|uniref:AAA family ATPase n=1 Tax=Aggregatilinea lenta TaxID=913108 RepID=UPI001EE98AA0|nr:AAA family ATPase [Aggregatilinea lenta]
MSHRFTQANADFCFGRDGLISSIVKDVHHQGAVLLFGGRQAGKTTVLLKTQQTLTRATLDVNELDATLIPVYIQLKSMANGIDATPSDFFRMLASQARSECEKRIQGFSLRALPSGAVKVAELETFKHDIEAIRQAAGQVDVDFLFLVDEAGKLNSRHFNSGFEDNLFVALYSREARDFHMYIVMAGSQELYRFVSDDGTSPIGARASCKYLTNLSRDAITAMIRYLNPTEPFIDAEKCGTLIFEATGGHPGLSAYMAHRLGIDTDPLTIISLIEDFRESHSNLFHMWYEHLTTPTRSLHNRLLQLGQMSREDILSFLRGLEEQKGNGPSYWFLKWSERASQELQFTGIVAKNGNGLEVVNKMYVDYMMPLGVSSAFSSSGNSDTEREIRFKARKIMELVQAVNSASSNRNEDFIFEITNQHMDIYFDLCRVAQNLDDFTHVVSAFYRLIYELTSCPTRPDGSHSKSLRRLPQRFREKQVVAHIGILRHRYGKAHIVERQNWRSKITESEVLKSYLDTAGPLADENCLQLQIALSDQTVNFLEELLQFITSRSSIQ